MKLSPQSDWLQAERLGFETLQGLLATSSRLSAGPTSLLSSGGIGSSFGGSKADEART